MKDIEDNIYGNQCGSDNAFTRKARLLQSMYRVEIGEEEGVGPTRASKRKYGNMISGGEVSGKNFLIRKHQLRTSIVHLFACSNELYSS